MHTKAQSPLGLNEVRSRFLAFMRERAHVIIPSASLLPKDDPTTLFTGSGMQPLVPYLLGKPHPAGGRLANSQKCFRQMDIEEVGDNRHTTFFEMLGNWSLGDYFKEEQLRHFFTFLTDPESGLGLSPERLYVTVFAGDTKLGIPKDDESISIWQDIFSRVGITASAVVLGDEENAAQQGMQGGRIFAYDAKKNWWSRAGVPEAMPPGEPGGPDSEVFYDFGPIDEQGKERHDPGRFGPYCHPNCDCGRFVEIGNSVFMEFIKQEDGTFAKLPQKNVDFGGGLERLTAAAQHRADVFPCAHGPIIDILESESKKPYREDEASTRAMRIVGDHMKAAVFLITDGAMPSNTEAGYVVRRLIRRSVRYADTLGLPPAFLGRIVAVVAQMYAEAYPEVYERQKATQQAVEEEEQRFRTTLAKGMRLLAPHLRTGNTIDGETVFQLVTTYGFPREMIAEIAAEHNATIDESGFAEAMQRHREQSRKGAERKFKGGLADHSEQTIKYHTATHLLHAALRKVLGEHVLQRGSNITAERLRFDFSHPQKLTNEECARVETLVNEWIQADLPVRYEDLPLAQARARGAIGLFGEKYPEIVRIYTIGDPSDSVSIEFCGGPHVEHTGVLGTFRIVKEEALAAGVRRIRAVLE